VALDLQLAGDDLADGAVHGLDAQGAVVRFDDRERRSVLIQGQKSAQAALGQATGVHGLAQMAGCHGHDAAACGHGVDPGGRAGAAVAYGAYARTGGDACCPKHRRQEFLVFLKQVAKALPDPAARALRQLLSPQDRRGHRVAAPSAPCTN
jgi:hypothetical protein